MPDIDTLMQVYIINFRFGLQRLRNYCIQQNSLLKKLTYLYKAIVSWLVTFWISLSTIVKIKKILLNLCMFYSPFLASSNKINIFKNKKTLLKCNLNEYFKIIKI